MSSISRGTKPKVIVNRRMRLADAIKTMFPEVETAICPSVTDGYELLLKFRIANDRSKDFAEIEIHKIHVDFTVDCGFPPHEVAVKIKYAIDKHELEAARMQKDQEFLISGCSW